MKSGIIQIRESLGKLGNDAQSQWKSICSVEELPYEQFCERISEINGVITPQNVKEMLLLEGFKRKSVKYEDYVRIFHTEQTHFSGYVSKLVKQKKSIISKCINCDKESQGNIKRSEFIRILEEEAKCSKEECETIANHYYSRDSVDYFRFLSDLNSENALDWVYCLDSCCRVRGPGNGCRGPLDPEIFPEFRNQSMLSYISKAPETPPPKPRSKVIEETKSSSLTPSKRVLSSSSLCFVAEITSLLLSKYQFADYFNKYQDRGLMSSETFFDSIQSEFQKSIPSENISEIAKYYKFPITISQFMQIINDGLNNKRDYRNIDGIRKIAEAEAIIQWISKRVVKKMWNKVFIENQSPQQITENLSKMGVHIDQDEIRKIFQVFSIDQIVSKINEVHKG